MSKIPNLYTFKNFANKHREAFTQPALRDVIFRAKPRKDRRGRLRTRANGFAAAFIRRGRRIYIDEDRFFACLYRKERRKGAA